MTKEDLMNYLEDEAGYSNENVNGMDCHELVEAWCTYNGFIGYADEIIDVVFAGYEDISCQMTFNEMDEDEQPSKLAELYLSMDAAHRDEFFKLIEG